MQRVEHPQPTVLSMYVVCPLCKGTLASNASDSFMCKKCSTSFYNEDGIPVFVRDHAGTTGHRSEEKKKQVNFYTKVGQYLEEVGNQLGYAQNFYYLNFGYLSNEKPQFSPVILPEQVLNRNSVKLTLEVVGRIDISDLTVVEIGCGRGGNLMTMQEYYQPAKLVGVDLCPFSIHYCKTNHPGAIDFIVGDAEELPLRDAFADVVFNLESSHAYPVKERFYQEVYRILKPGGYFLYSDSLPVNEHFMAEGYLQEIGFDIVHNRDITSNVLLSCDKIAAIRALTFQNVIQTTEQKALRDFVATPESDVYQNMKSKKWMYKIVHFRKAI